jgi:methylmalonyl-CoA mutase
MSAPPRRFDFDPVDRAAWELRAREELGGRAPATLERASFGGPKIGPLYGPGDAPGSDWLPIGPRFRTVQVYAMPNPADVARAAAADLAGGAQGLWVVLPSDLQSGGRPAVGSGAAGVQLDRGSAMARLLRDLDLARVPVCFECGAAGIAVAGMLAFVVGDAIPGVAGGVLCDPLAALARSGALAGGLPRAFEDMAEVAIWSRTRAPDLATVGVSTVPYHEGGAGPVLELAVAAATAIEYLRRLDQVGIDPRRTAGALVFAGACGRDLFLEIAKLRALRRIWARILQACGIAPEAAPLRLHVRGSGRGATRRDPWVNLLRGELSAVAAIVGGAEMVATAPFDAGSSEQVRRLALDTQVILREEAGLDAVADPAAGSYLVEALTDELCQAAWARMQGIEATGGASAALQSGAIAAEIAGLAEALRRAVAVGELVITGVSHMVDLDDPPPPTESSPRPPAAARGVPPPADQDARQARLAALSASVRGARVASAAEAFGAGADLRAVATAIADPDPAARVEPIDPLRLAEPFERLRDRSDAWTAAEGRRPTVVLVAVGSAADQRAGVEAARDLLAAGGLEASVVPHVDLGRTVEAYAASGAVVAVPCGASAVLEEIGDALATALEAGGAHLVQAAPAAGTDRVAWLERIWAAQERRE